MPHISATNLPEQASTTDGDVKDLASSLKKKAAARTKLSQPDTGTDKLLLATSAALPDVGADTTKKHKAKRKRVAVN